MRVRHVPTAVLIGTDVTIERRARTAASRDLAIDEAYTMVLEQGPCVTCVPSERHNCLPFWKVFDELGDPRGTGRLPLPRQKQLVVLSSIVLEGVLLIHVDGRLERLQRGRTVAELMQGSAHIELHDNHRMVVERVAIELHGAAALRDRYSQLVFAFRFLDARRPREVQPEFEVGDGGPTVGEHNTRFGICIDAAELLLGLFEAFQAGVRRAVEEKLRIVELRIQHRGGVGVGPGGASDCGLEVFRTGRVRGLVGCGLRCVGRIRRCRQYARGRWGSLYRARACDEAARRGQKAQKKWTSAHPSPRDEPRASQWAAAPFSLILTARGQP